MPQKTSSNACVAKPFPLKARFSTEIKDFGRTAQSCDLLGHVLELVTRQPYAPADPGEVKKLDTSLQNLLSIILKQSEET